MEQRSTLNANAINPADYPDYEVCRSRSGVYRKRHDYDKDGVCFFCDYHNLSAEKLMNNKSIKGRHGLKAHRRADQES